MKINNDDMLIVFVLREGEQGERGKIETSLFAELLA